MLVKVDRKNTKTVVDALIRTAHQLPNELYQSLAWDHGKAMADHRRFTLATDIQVHFRDPQSPLAARLEREHQRPSAAVLSERHRPVLETPIERYRQAVALTG